MDYPKFIVSNQKEESISIQRVNLCGICCCFFLLKTQFYFLFLDVGDKMIEVVGLENSMHAAQVYAGLRASGKRLAQCQSVVIR